MISQKTLIQELIGHNVTQLKKLEIKQIVDHAGLLVLLQLCLTEFVLLLDKKFKLEFHQKIYYLVVDHVDLDVKEDIHQLLGVMLYQQDLLLVVITVIKMVADLIHSQIVIIIVQEDMDHAQLLAQPLLVKKNVNLVIQLLMLKILKNSQDLMVFHQKSHKFKLN